VYCLAPLIGLLLVVSPLLLQGMVPQTGNEVTTPDTFTAPGMGTPIPDAGQLLSGLGDCFFENRGQVADPSIRFYAQGRGLSVGLTSSGMVVTLRREVAEPGPEARDVTTVQTMSFRVTFEGARAVEPQGAGPLALTLGFFSGPDPDRWVTSAASFEEVVYEGLYPGVDLWFSIDDGALKYAFLVSPSADASHIVLSYTGVLGVDVDTATADLLIETPLGIVRDPRPVITQDGVGGGEGLPGFFLSLGDGRVGFVLPEGLLPGRPYVIDPGLVFSTFLGGSGEEYAHAVVVDGNGDIFVGGITGSADFPVSSDAYNPVGYTKFGNMDCFIAKFDALGQPIRLTYVAGERFEYINGLAIDNDGDVLAMGTTRSNSFPTTPDAVSRSLNGGPVGQDAFLVKLTGDLHWLSYGSYLGGTNSEDGYSVDVDSSDRAYVGFITNSSDLYTTPGAFCETYLGAGAAAQYEDAAVVMRFNPSMQRTYCSYVNDLGIYSDIGCAMIDSAVGASGRFYLTSFTSSRKFNTTPSSAIPAYKGGAYDGFVIGLDMSGNGASDLAASTFLGGSGADYPWSIKVGTDGRVYVGGETRSGDFPVTADAIQGAPHGTSDGFLAVLDGVLSSIQFCTYIGGSKEDLVMTVALAPDQGKVALLGGTASANLDVTVGCYDPTPRSSIRGWTYIAVIDVDAPALDYCTFMGGSISDFAGWRGLICDDDGDVIIGMGTSSTDYPTTPRAFDRTLGGPADAIVVRLDPTACGPPPAPSNVMAMAGDKEACLTWNGSTNVTSRCTGYKVYMGTSPDDLGSPWNIPPSRTRFNFTGLVNGVTYYFGVSGVNSAGEGPTGNASARPLGRSSVPMNITASTGDGTVTLHWSTPIDDGGGVLGYLVMRGTSPSDLVPLGSVIGPGNGTFRDTGPGLVMGSTYLYGVIAWNEAGNGTTGLVTVVPTTVPDPPTGLRVDGGDRSAQLTWGPPTSDGGSPVLGYCVYRGLTSEGMTLLARLTTPEPGHLDEGLENTWTYYYSVSAFNANGEGRASEFVSAIPVGPPSEPTDLRAIPGDAEVHLSWGLPLADNGRSVTGYRVYMGATPGLASLKTVAQARDATVTGLVNGKLYWFLVTAVNMVGEGPKASVAATPYGVPTEPNGLQAEGFAGGILLQWSVPAQTGGAANLTYRVLRGPSQDTLAVVAELNDTFEWRDTGVRPGTIYWYSVLALNSMWEGPGATAVTASYLIAPGRATELSAKGSDGSVTLRWYRPESDGGTPIQVYLVYRDRMASEGSTEMLFLNETGPDTLEYVDRSVTNGLEYTYCIVAKNRMGPGAMSDPAAATPTGPPPAPELTLERVGDGVVLRWSMPSKQGGWPVTGFIVLRGESPTTLKQVATLGMVLNFTAGDVRSGATTYFQVVPTTAKGDGPPSNVPWVTIEPPAVGENRTTILGIAVAVVAIVIVALALVAARARRRKAGAPEEEEEEPPEGPVVVDAGEAGPPKAKVPSAIAAGAAVTAAAVAPVRPGFIVEQVLVTHHDGQLVASLTKEGYGTADVDLMSGMLIAVQGIAQDGLHREGMLQSIKYGENLIVISSGEHLALASVVYGEPDARFSDLQSSVLQSLEASFAGVLDEWTGDSSAQAAIEGLLSPLLEPTAGVRREDVTAPSAQTTVSVVSAVDLHRGYVRLKAAAVNPTDKVLIDAAISVEYDADMLRLERVEPFTLKRRGDRVVLGNIKPHERKTVAFMFDPQICQGTHLDGYLTYFDADGQRHRVEMKRRHAEVVCPIFFTKEHANTAMLRRLIKDGLRTSDSRAFRFPQDVEPSAVFDLGKQAMGMSAVQLVRESVVSGPPYEAEAWYYGETKVKGYQMVMRLCVVEERQALELFIASTTMGPITGLLSEFRRELQRVVDERSPVRFALETMRPEEGDGLSDADFPLPKDDGAGAGEGEHEGAAAGGDAEGDAGVDAGVGTGGDEDEPPEGNSEASR
jgi:hypothetical protein